MQITVQIKQVYGNETIYPICETAKKLAALAGHKTLTPSDIKLITALGYTFALHQDTPNALRA